MKNPNLKCRYSKGLGDLVACVLHSKAVGWLTHIITGQKEPCQACSQRAEAMNILFPIPFWRLFFKNYDELILALAEDFKKEGFAVDIDEETKTVSAFKQENIETEEKEKTIEMLSQDDNLDLDESKLTLVSANEMDIGTHIICVKIFKK